VTSDSYKATLEIGRLFIFEEEKAVTIFRNGFFVSSVPVYSAFEVIRKFKKGLSLALGYFLRIEI